MSPEDLLLANTMQGGGVHAAASHGNGGDGSLMMFTVIGLIIVCICLSCCCLCSCTEVGSLFYVEYYARDTSLYETIFSNNTSK